MENVVQSDLKWSERDQTERKELESLQSKLQAIRCHLNLDIYEEIHLSTETLINTGLIKLKESIDGMFERSVHINHHFSQMKSKLEKLDPDVTSFETLFRNSLFKKLNRINRDNVELSQALRNRSFQELVTEIHQRILETDQNQKEYVKRLESLQKSQYKKWMEMEKKCDQKQSAIDQMKLYVCECKREEIQANPDLLSDKCTCLEKLLKLRMELDEKNALLEESTNDSSATDTATTASQIKRLSHLLQEKSTQASEALDQVKKLKGQTLVDIVTKNDQEELIQELKNELEQKQQEMNHLLVTKENKQVSPSPLEQKLTETEADLETALEQLNIFGKERLDDMAQQSSLKKQLNDLITKNEIQSKEFSSQIDQLKSQIHTLSLENQNLRVSNAELKIKLKNASQVDQTLSSDINNTLAVVPFSKKENSVSVFKGLSNVEFDLSEYSSNGQESIVQVHDYRMHPFFFVWIAIWVYYFVSSVIDYYFYEKPQ